MTTTPDDEYTPTTEQVRRGYQGDTNVTYQRLRAAEFDRWLAQHDAGVAAGALLAAASASARPENGAPCEVWAWFSRWMCDRAARIARGAR